MATPEACSNYPAYYMDSDGLVYCAPCASEFQYREQRPTEEVQHLDGPPEICGQCGAEIHSCSGEEAEE